MAKFTVTQAEIEQAAIDMYATRPDRMRFEWDHEEENTRAVCRMQVRTVVRSLGGEIELPTMKPPATTPGGEEVGR